MTAAKFKRFYERAAAEPCPPSEGGTGGGDGFRVVLDGRPIKTPAKADLVLPSLALAEAVAAEWQAQGAEVEVRSLALTGLVWTAIDRVGSDRARVVEEVAAYAAHDLVCYRAEAPAELVARQQTVWQPLLDWAALSFEARLAVTAGVVPIAQSPEALAALRQAVAAKSDLELTALGAAVTAAGSLVIGLALGAGRIDAAAAFEAAQLDESYQIERWGEDPEAARRRAAIHADLEAAARLMALLRD
ncbi:MAG: ATPase [Proteobacteria bacterium]|nr:ATPase [Pseudomonadota bacterium]